MFYPPKIQFGLSNAKAKLISDVSASGRAASLECGSFVAFDLFVNDEQLIDDIAFRTNGCGFMIAVAEVLTKQIRGKNLSDLHGLDDDDLTEIAFAALDVFPGERRQCLRTCLEALHSAFADLRTRRVEEFKGEKALICSCFGVSEETIDEYILAGRARSVEDVTNLCNAGGGCGSCRMLIQEMIDDALTEPEGGRML